MGARAHCKQQRSRVGILGIAHASTAQLQAGKSWLLKAEASLVSGERSTACPVLRNLPLK